MALSDYKLLLPATGEWVEYEPTSEYFTIKNNSNVEVQYTYDTTEDTFHKLGYKEDLPVINQKVFFRTFETVKMATSLEITKGVNQLVAIANLSSGIGADNAIKLDSWGLQKFSQDYRVWRATFCSGVSRKVWNISQSGGGNTLPVQGSGLFSSGDAVGDHISCFAKKHARYQPNSGILISTAGTIPSHTSTGGVRRWGAATIEDGYFFEISEDGICYTVVRQSDFQNIISEENQTKFYFTHNILSLSTVYVRVKYSGKAIWDDITIDISTIDTTEDSVTMQTELSAGDEICIVSVNDLKNEITSNLNEEGIDLSKQVLFDIQASGGAGNVTFKVRSASSSSIPTVVSATFNNLGQNSRPNISNPTLSSLIECKNVSADGSNFQLKIEYINIAAEGGQKDTSELEAVSNDIKVPVTVGHTEDDIFTMIVCNPTYYKGRVNTRDIEAIQFSTRADQIFFSTAYLTNNLLFLTGALVLKERDVDSCILYDNNLSLDNSTARGDEVDISTLKDLITKGEEANKTIDVLKMSSCIEAVVTPGECFVVIPRKEGSSGTAIANTTILFGERT